MNLEHAHLGRRSSRHIAGDLVVDRLVRRPGDLVVEVASDHAGKRAQPDLKPFIRAVRPFSRTANADPAGNVAMQYRKRFEGDNGRRDPEGRLTSGEPRIRVAARPTGHSPSCASKRPKSDGTGDEQELTDAGQRGMAAVPSVCPRQL